LKILEEYLPEKLSEEEIKGIVKQIIEKVEAKDMKDFGKVMKYAMVELRGRADGETVRKIVEDLLKS